VYIGNSSPAAAIPALQQLRDALGRGAWTAAITLARARGETNENRLTDMVFAGRYPQRRPGSPVTRAQQREWITIRNGLVRPVLARFPVGSSTAASSSGFRPVPVEARGGRRIEDLRPPDAANVVVVSGVGGKRVPLHRLAAAGWAEMVKAARAAGIQSPLLLPVSGYRSPERQKRLWANALKKYGSPAKARKWVAPPGGSAHQTGRAIDLYLGGRNASENVATLRTLPAYSWLVANAARFGFYPYEKEPWHWEYNPPVS
jgi:D-alanyl-D-alanine carboxypeptidase